MAMTDNVLQNAYARELTRIRAINPNMSPEQVNMKAMAAARAMLGDNNAARAMLGNDNAAAVSNTATDEPTTSRAGNAWRDAMGIYKDVMSLMSPVAAGGPGGQIRTKVFDKDQETMMKDLLKQETASARDARINNELLARIPGGSGPEEYNLVPQINVPPGSTAPEPTAVDIDALMKKYYPNARPVATGAVTAPVGTSTTTTPGNKIDYAKLLMDRATARDTRGLPNLENPNTEADLTERMKNIKVPTRPGFEDMSRESQAKMLFALSKGFADAPRFGSGLSAGLTNASAVFDKDQETMMKDLMTKYGIDADMAMKLATARGSDLAGRNVNATSKYNMGTQNLAAGDAAIGSAGTVANAAELARLRAISDADENDYRMGILRRYERVDADAATKALDERRAKEPGYQFLEAERMRNQFKGTPLEKQYDQFMSTQRKGETRKDRLEALIKSSEPIRKEDPGSARARAYELIFLNWDKYGDDPDKLVEIINAAVSADAKNRK